MFSISSVCIALLLVGLSLASPLQQQPNSKGALLDKASSTAAQSAVVMVQGWAANATSGFTVGDRATDVQACLEQCRNSWSPRCRLVSYNIETGACVRFSKQSANVGYPGMFNGTDDSWPWPKLLQFRRDNDAIIAADSQKKFELLENAQVNGDYIIFLSDVRSSETCRDLCHVHPTCNVASSSMYGSVATGCQLRNIVHRNPYGPVDPVYPFPGPDGYYSSYGFAPNTRTYAA